MRDAVFEIPPLFTYIATFTWAVSGAIVAIRKQFDATGVFVIAVLSSTGGGLLRDALFLQRMPAFLFDPVYLPLVGATTLLVLLFTRRMISVARGDTAQKFVDLIDSLGTPAFTVIGMQLARDHGIPMLGVVLIGAVNGLAGGLLRDVVVRDVPSLLRPGQFVSLILVFACVVFQVLTIPYGVRPNRAAWVAIGVFFVLRLGAIKFNWRTQSVWTDAEPRGERRQEDRRA